MFVVLEFVSIVVLIGLTVVAVLSCYVLFSWGRLVVMLFNDDVDVRG